MDSLSSPSASGSESVAQLARFVSVEKCGCAQFDCDYDFHAAIETVHRELVNDSAVVMSYTWGKINREDRLIGHKKDDPTAAVSMRLGEEWVFPDFIESLIDISDLCGAVWIDQLCIPEGDEEFNALLAAIPDIYRTLHVQVLMPGQCFVKRAAPLLDGEPGKFAEPVAQLARFVSVKKCGCAQFDCDYDFHGAIETVHRELVNDSAVAVSYTWGEFNREDRLIGHKKDDPTAAVRMNLGEEWVFPDFIDSLIDISDLCGAVWIDQLCLPEKDDAVNALLAAIPDIYRTLDVQVLMPGNVCQCFVKRAAPLLDGEPGKFAELFDEKDRGDCYNELGMSSYTGRLWPRQEFLYARKVQLKWNCKTFAECVLPPLSSINGKVDESVIEKLNPYTKILYKQLESNTDVDMGLFPSIQNTDVDVGLFSSIRNHSEGLYITFREIGLFDADNPNKKRYDNENVTRLLTLFLLGHAVEKPPLTWQVRRARELEAGSSEEDADEITELEKLWWFIITTAMLGQSDRNATKGNDYVLSVFVDMPRYTIPVESKIMKPLELLEDAIVQMENKLNATMPTRAPAGLFDKLPSVSWRPSLHSSKDHFQTAAEVYSSLPGCPAPLQFIEGRVPLSKFVSESRSIMKRSSLYSDSFPQEDMGMVASICEKISANWPVECRSRLGELERDLFDSTLRFAVASFYHNETEFMYEEGLPFSEDLFVQCLLIYHLQQSRYRRKGTSWELVWTNMRCIDHHDTLYRVTSFLLGLDYKICQDHGLKLVIALGEPVCLGLTAKSFSRHGQSAASTDEVSSKDNIYLTVSTAWTHAIDSDDGRVGDCLLETCEDWMRDSPIEQPCYRVIGSWLPLSRVDMTDIGARIFHRVTNSLGEEESKRCDGSPGCALASRSKLLWEGLAAEIQAAGVDPLKAMGWTTQSGLLESVTSLSNFDS